MNTLKKSGLLVFFAIIFLLSCSPSSPPVAFFYAAGFADVARELENSGNWNLRSEGNGSLTVCRKISELHRPCDVVVLADPGLVTSMLGKLCEWRIDFASDALVLGVGMRAPNVEEVENDWTILPGLSAAILARADENTAPIGYRTLLAIELAEQRSLACRKAEFSRRFLEKATRRVPDVEQLAALLKSGEADYAILYRSTCIAQGIRYISLGAECDLGSPDRDYSHAKVSFQKLKSGSPELITAVGEPILWCIAQPSTGSAPEAVVSAFIRAIVSNQAARLEAAGLTPLLKPRFYGTAAEYARFSDIAEQ